MLRKTSIIIASALLYALAAGVCAATVDDYLRRDVVPLGVTTGAGGIELGDLMQDAAAETIRAEIVAPLQQPLTLAAAGQNYTLDSSRYVEVDVEKMVRAAIAPSRSSALSVRVWRRLTETPVNLDIPVEKRVAESEVGVWINDTAKQIAIPAVDASRTVERTGVTITPEKQGRSVDTSSAAKLLREALLDGTRSVQAPIRTIKPKVTSEDFGRVIIVRLDKRKLYLYEGEKLLHTYGVAIGTSAHPTPTGEWKIVNKVFMPSWHNPGTAWAKSMPKSIPSGPSNPLGTRALYLNASGIRIHGTTNNGSIGTAASHGCMRMHRWDIEALYPEVPVETPVYIMR